MIHQLYFFARDDSDQAGSLQGNNEEAYETAMEMFEGFRTDDGIGRIEFYLPENN